MAIIDGSGDTIDSGGNLINQTVDESAIDSSGSNFQQITSGDSSQTFEGKCLEDTYGEDEGDPDDFLGKEDPDNDPANDGCNAPECPTPDLCDHEPIDSPCASTINIVVVFYGLKLVGQVIATKFHIDQYCFNSDSAADDFGTKMKVIIDAQPKPQLGDTQIEFGGFFPSLIQPCGDIPNTRPDAALINFRQFPTGPFGPFPPNCPKEADEIPVTDPCVPPDYL